MLNHEARFSVPDDQGALVVVPAGSAKATVLDFWATSCAPCSRSVPTLASRAPTLSSQGIDLRLVGVLDEGESIDDARAVLTGWGVTQGFLVDRGGSLLRQLNIDSLPATMVLDDAGVVRWVAPSGATVDEVERAAGSIAR